MKRALIAILPACLLSAAAPPSPPAPTPSSSDYLNQFIDPTVNPRDNFFRYAVGKWLKANPIPPNERSWGIAHVVQEETYRRLVSINDSAAEAKAARGSNTQKIGDFWHAAMDSEAVAKEGIAPLAPEFARIQGIKDRQGLLDDIAHLKRVGVGALCGLYIFQDEMKSDRYAVHLYQGGLGLPDRDYYFDTDARSTKIRDEYVVHVEHMFELLGDEPAKAKASAATVMSMETDLAKASRKLEDLRDPHKNYNAMSLDAVSKLTPSIRWRHFLDEGEIHGVDTVVVGQPEFFQQVEKSWTAHSLDDWKTYLRWHLIHEYAEQAGGKYDAENFHFYGTIMNGTPEQRPRWKRMLDQEENYLGDALGQLYVQRYFSPRTKERYEKMTNEIFAAFADRIRNLDWMSEPTKQRALTKLAAVTKKVGYPEKWKDYSKYDVERSSFLTNCIRGNQWTTDFYIAKLHKPVDRTEWDMTTQTYNAYYNP